MATAIGGQTGALLLMAALGCGAFGCGGGAIGLPGGGEMACTLIGCHDQFSANVTVDTTMVPAGRHTVTVTIDGAATYCTLQLPPSARETARSASTASQVGRLVSCARRLRSAVSAVRA